MGTFLLQTSESMRGALWHHSATSRIFTSTSHFRISIWTVMDGFSVRTTNA